MSQMRVWCSRFAGLFGKEQKDRELDEELGSHLQMHIDDNVRSGMNPVDARRQALIKLGGTEPTKKRYRDRRGFPWLESLLQDLHFGTRMLRKSPDFTVMAILTLALGIGANTAVYSVVNAIVIRPFPVERPNEIVTLENNYGNSMSFPNYQDLRDRNRAFSGLVGYRISPIELDTGSGPVRSWGYLATGNYFDVLGVKPILGRLFGPSDDLTPGASPLVVLSYDTWRSRFNSDFSIVGKTIRINRLSFTVLGVAPQDFHGTELFFWPELWVPMMMEPQIEPGNPWLDKRNTLNTEVVGRLKTGVVPAQAVADLNAIATELSQEYPTVNDSLKFKLATPGLMGDTLGTPAKAFLLSVLGLAGLVLLAACANLASLLTARVMDRGRELAIRVAVGASRGRVLRQLLTETLIISLGGWGAGLALAAFLSRALSRWRAPMDFPVQFNVNPDWRVLLFASITSIVAGVLFGIAPAWLASRTEPNAALKDAQVRGWRFRRLALRDVLVVVQIAVCFVLVYSCFLSLWGLQQALKMHLGFEPHNVSMVSFDLGLARYSEDRGRTFQRRALEVVQQLPGTSFGAYSNSLPLNIDQSTTTVYPANANRPSDRKSVTYYQVSPGFFATLGTRLQAGRDFTWRDDSNGARVAIINTAFEKEILHTNNPVGMQFRRGLNGPTVEIVGVVETGKYRSLTEAQQPVVFWPIQQSYSPSTTLTVKTSLPPAEAAEQMRHAISQIDPDLPFYGAGGFDEMLKFAFFPTQAAAMALGAFGMLAVLLAVTGIYGLVSYAVSRRVREIGIRTALGASSAQVLMLVLGRMAVLVAVGSAFGFVLAIAIGQVLAHIVYGTQSGAPFVLAGVCAALALIGILSSWSPARRALRIKPMTALRYE